MSADIGLIGLAVMGENLVLNIESRGYTAAVYNRTTSKVDEFVNGRGKGKKFIGCHTPEELIKNLKKPRKVILMVKAGEVVDKFIESLAPLLEKGDIIIDGGNSHYPDTNRRVKELEAKGLLFIGTGVSGGEEGALKGPSIMPGGSSQAWPAVKEIFQAISAKVEKDVPCCDWVGDGGAGHYVKMVHNGIEYGDIQLICEAYQLLRDVAGLNNDEIKAAFEQYNTGDLDSYLIEITAAIFGKKDGDQYVVDTILDVAGQKGTGKWTAINALDLNVPVTLIGEAVFARCLSALKDERVKASKTLPGPLAANAKKFLTVDKKKFIGYIADALLASKFISYAQGYTMMRAAANEYKWKLNYGAIALMWRGGCIIRSTFLSHIKAAFDKNAELPNLLLDDWFQEKLQAVQEGWREVAATALKAGIPIPAISTALSYYDGYRSEKLPANLLQAQRDFFGAHTYEKIGEERGKAFHTNWTGHGGTTHSSTYNA